MELGTIEREIYVEASPEVVYEVVSSPDHLKEWWPDDARYEATPGSVGEIVFGDPDAGGAVVSFTVVEARAPESSWSARIFSAVAEATLRILPRMGRIAWVLRSRACLAEPPALSPSTMNSSVPSGSSDEQSVSLPGRRSLRALVAVLRCTSRSARPAEALLHPLDDRAEQRSAAVHVVGEIMVETVADGGLDEARRLRLVRRSWSWLWKWGLRMNTESISSTPLKTSSAVMSLAFLLPTSSPKPRMPLVRAARRPASWVPPSGVGMVLQ